MQISLMSPINEFMVYDMKPVDNGFGSGMNNGLIYQTPNSFGGHKIDRVRSLRFGVMMTTREEIPSSQKSVLKEWFLKFSMENEN